MREARKNASACSLTADTLYVFGGTSNSYQTLSSIEQYSIALNRWQLLKISLPRALCFLTSFKLSSTQILILGGSMRESLPSKQVRQPNAKSFLSNQVFLFDVLEPRFTRVANMKRGFISLYPAFYDGVENQIVLVNEDSVENEPECLRYNLDQIGYTG